MLIVIIYSILSLGINQNIFSDLMYRYKYRRFTKTIWIEVTFKLRSKSVILYEHHESSELWKNYVLKSILTKYCSSSYLLSFIFRFNIVLFTLHWLFVKVFFYACIGICYTIWHLALHTRSCFLLFMKLLYKIYLNIQWLIL